MDRKVTIELSLTDALTANSFLSTELREYASVEHNYMVRGKDVPNWMERESEALRRITQIMHEAITDQ